VEQKRRAVGRTALAAMVSLAPPQGRHAHDRR
jgi:hypothetical protein